MVCVLVTAMMLMVVIFMRVVVMAHRMMEVTIRHVHSLMMSSHR